ncbi:MAG: glutamate-5-semialdehyde dehydrogenase [Pseudomonadota bacterium]|nr:glutamate-5-semialdehyde dehydrogenase [Pseudomonadota bacterium]
MNKKKITEEEVLEIGSKAKSASLKVSLLSEKEKNSVLHDAADNIRKNKDFIIEQNVKDIKENKEKLNSALLDRLMLDKARIDAMCSGLKDIAELEDPIGKILGVWKRPNGLKIEKVSIPLGVIGVIYESRPNVAADAAGLCLKSGNTLILRGGSESYNSSSTIVKIIKESMRKFGLPEGALQNIPTTDREAVGSLLKMDQYVDVIIPRGGKSLIERVSKESRVHVIKHLDGICHTYIHKSSDPEMCDKVAVNAKMRRPGICGATETILCDIDVVKSHLPKLIRSLKELNCEIRGDEEIMKIDNSVLKAKEDDWSTEYLDKIVSIKTIKNGVNEAVDHINFFGSGHTDAIISKDKISAEFFLNNVDSGIVMHNTSTQFADGGEFGMGAEIGISTSKVHARGPVGVAQLTSFKYKVRGKGQIRP